MTAAVSRLKGLAPEARGERSLRRPCYGSRVEADYLEACFFLSARGEVRFPELCSPILFEFSTRRYDSPGTCWSYSYL